MGNMKSVGSSVITGGSSSSPITLPSIAVNEFKTFTTNNAYGNFKLPSGGRYLIISNVYLRIGVNNSENLAVVAVAAGGSTVFDNFTISVDARKGFYFRVS